MKTADRLIPPTSIRRVIPAGAEAFRRDNPNATVQFLDTGHFALETHVEEIALAIRNFLEKCRTT